MLAKVHLFFLSESVSATSSSIKFKLPQTVATTKITPKIQISCSRRANANSIALSSPITAIELKSTKSTKFIPSAGPAKTRYKNGDIQGFTNLRQKASSCRPKRFKARQIPNGVENPTKFKIDHYKFLYLEITRRKNKLEKFQLLHRAMFPTKAENSICPPRIEVIDQRKYRQRSRLETMVSGTNFQSDNHQNQPRCKPIRRASIF